MSDEPMDDGTLDIFPPWKQAVEAFCKAGHEYGELLPREELERALGIEPLPGDAVLTVDAFQKRQFAWLQQFYPFRDGVLERCQMDLRSDGSGNYVIALPKDQAEQAYKDMVRGIKRALRAGRGRIVNVNMSLLSMQERQKATDIAVKAAMIAGLMSRRVLPGDDEE